MKKLILISFTLMLAYMIVEDQTLNTAYSSLLNNVDGVSNRYKSTYSNIETTVDEIDQQKDEKVEQMNETIDQINRIRAFLVEVDQRYFEYEGNSGILEDIDCTEYLVKPDTRCKALTEECGYYVDDTENVIDLYEYCPTEYLDEAKKFFGLEDTE